MHRLPTQFQAPLKSQGRPFWFVLLFNLSLVVAAAIFGAAHGDLSVLFREEALMTWWSTVQMIAIAIVAGLIFRKRSPKPFTWGHPSNLWLIISIGFVFLAADEILTLHEIFDEIIHSVLNWEETSLSDRLDDALVGGYAAIAACLLYRYRQELKRYAFLLPSLFLSFLLIGLMISLDAATNGDSFFIWLFGEQLGPTVLSYAAFVEDSCKVLAQGVFLSAFYRVLQSLGRSKQVDSNPQLEKAN